MKEVLKKSIKVLGVDESTLEKLNEKEVSEVYELCLLNRKALKEYGLTSNEINNVIVRLQLEGLDLNKKYKIN